MKWTREDYIELMTFGNVERQMFVELFGPLIGLEEEWKGQGASQDQMNMIGFDFDYVPKINCGGDTFRRGGLKPTVLEETHEYIIHMDDLGRTMKLCKGKATIPLPLDYPVKDMDSWLKVKSMYQFSEDRINWDAVEAAKNAQKNGVLVRADIPGGFDEARELMGEEELCLSYYTQPELMYDIIDTISQTAYQVLDRVSDHVVIDNLSVHEDMAGKSGPLIGPNIITKFIKPYYRSVWDMLSSKGTKIFSQDSDGDMNSVIDSFLDCGVNVMYPAEPAAGMDIVKLRKKYGDRLAFKGGIDKHILRSSKDAILKELEYKMQPLMKGGGMVFGLDHRIPNGTPLENYIYYINTSREILGLPPLDGQRKGWERMAF
ncbi:uroporphyrinogen decarboxylase family protein [Vallitalea okinawensis]|uniref:uroporphyrinogen decarboxylase family protein n=1 Tax=Vallitalea okinawensis TaxID=2078660 RepID=UPI000CFA9BBE|nr:uroporphyrinogen decarboxylase family protein [Vallitalea okinawensis]